VPVSVVVAPRTNDATVSGDHPLDLKVEIFKTADFAIWL
jgi:hypothetical protein